MSDSGRRIPSQQAKKEKEMEHQFEEWAILELMGHRHMAGKVTDAVIGGGAFLRIDVPSENGEYSTQYYSAASVYCITPTSEEIARTVAKQSQPAPVSRWEFPQLAQAQPIEAEYPDDNDYSEDEGEE